MADSRSSTKAAIISGLENWLSDIKLSAEQSSLTLTGREVNRQIQARFPSKMFRPPFIA
jgi:hypothetical protein